MSTSKKAALCLGALVLLHGFFMLYRYGQLPIVPAYSEEVVVNDSALSLARGQGYVEASFAGSALGVDKVFAHFPPLYPLVVALTFRLFGVSVYSLRLTTTIMSIASTVLLALLLYRVSSKGQVPWEGSLIVMALYSTNATLVSLEREARMESMIGFFCLLGVLGLSELFLRRSGQRSLPIMVLTACAGAGCLAVHLESISALLLLAGLLAFVVTDRPWEKMLCVVTAVALPALLFLVVLRGHVVSGYQQFHSIFANRYHDLTFMEWLRSLPHLRHIAELNTYFFMIELVALLLFPLVYFALCRDRLDRVSLRYRLLVCLASVSALELILMVSFLGMNRHRYQFLFGPMLALNAICGGAACWRPWLRHAAWGLAATQLCMTVLYLVPGRHLPEETDPERFQRILAQVPAQATLAASSQLWMDLQEDGRPFTCLLKDFDGEQTWAAEDRNPLDRFDAIVLEDIDWEDAPALLWRAEAAEGRQEYSYTVGTHRVELYLRKGMAIKK